MFLRKLGQRQAYYCQPHAQMIARNFDIDKDPTFYPVVNTEE